MCWAISRREADAWSSSATDAALHDVLPGLYGKGMDPSLQIDAAGHNGGLDSMGFGVCCSKLAVRGPFLRPWGLQVAPRVCATNGPTCQFAQPQ